MHNTHVLGGDDRRVLLWRTSHFSAIRTPTPIIMKTQHMENIFSTVFDCQKNHVFSAGKLLCFRIADYDIAMR